LTPVGDIELELVLRVSVRGRTSDLAKLLHALGKAQKVVFWMVEEESEKEHQQDVEPHAQHKEL
jgi:hypothetical protein